MNKKFDDWLEQQLGLKTGTPTYPARDSMPVEEARARVASDFRHWLQVADEWRQRQSAKDDDDANPFELYGDEHAEKEDEDPPPVHAQRSPTGVGKTQIGAGEIAADRKARRDAGDEGPMAVLPYGYSGPTHRLNEGVADQFRRHGLSAQVYYGRGTWDRGIDGNKDLPEDERTKMCLKPERVALAISAHQSVPETCCHKKPRRGKGGKEEKCEHYDEGSNQCGYQRQFNGGAPDIWLMPHEMMFHEHKALSKLAGLIIDESYWAKGVYGIGEGQKPLSLEQIFSDTTANTRQHREHLIDLLNDHPIGGLQRDRIVGKITKEDCTEANGREWAVVNSVRMTPGMTEVQILDVMDLLPRCRTARRMATVYKLLREFLDSDIEVSGRLILGRNDAGQTVLRVRGIRSIVKGRQIPSMILDATLPDESILRKFHPQVKVVFDVEVEMPYVHVRQFPRAPTSETKLWGPLREREKNPDAGIGNRKAVRRFVLERWLQIDGPRLWAEECRRQLEPGELRRRPLVVIAQMKYREWLEESGLPDGIALEHYNAIAGLDDHKYARGLILVGRVVPKPAEAEAFSGAITGVEPLSEKATGWWYGEAVPRRAIRLADGTGVEVERSDRHVDDVAEMVRFQICECEIIQSFGRGRGVNRDALTPLDVDILTDVVVPITVDEVLPWEAPSEMIEAAVEGAVPTAPTDMAAAYPGLWKNADAAKWALKKLAAGARARNREEIPYKVYSYVGKLLSVPVHAIQYQRAGAKQKFHWAVFNLRHWPFARAWFAARGWAVAIRDYIWPHEFEPMAGAGGSTSSIAWSGSYARRASR